MGRFGPWDVLVLGTFWSFHLSSTGCFPSIELCRQKSAVLEFRFNSCCYCVETHKDWNIVPETSLTLGLYFDKIQDGDSQHIKSEPLKFATLATGEHWIQRITFTAETNAVCSRGSADAQQ